MTDVTERRDPTAANDPPSVAAGRTYHVTARSAVGGTACVTANGCEISFDASAGQSDVLPGPAELLTASFAACVLKNVERFSRILRFDYQRASIAVEAERQDSPPKMIAVRYVLRVVTNESPQRVELMHHNIRRHGTIFNTLAAVCEVTGVIVAEPTGSG